MEYKALLNNSKDGKFQWEMSDMIGVSSWEECDSCYKSHDGGDRQLNIPKFESNNTSTKGVNQFQVFTAIYHT